VALELLEVLRTAQATGDIVERMSKEDGFMRIRFGEALWRLTGEPYDSRPFRHRDAHRPSRPARPLDGPPGERGFGAVELACRYANGDMDRDFFTLGFTSYDVSSQEFRTLSGGLNWDPTPWLRISGEVVRTIADQRPGVFDSHGRDTSGLARVQLAF